MKKPVLVLLPFKRSLGNGREQSREIIAEYLSVPAEHLQFIQTDSGKPVLAGFPDVHIGISHSRNILAVYIGPENAGIDVEFVKPRIYMEDMARIICTDEELQLFESAGTEQLRVFYELWTRKEAAIKKAGGNLTDLFAEDMAPDSTYRHWLVTGDYMVCMAASQRMLSSVSVESKLSSLFAISPVAVFEEASGNI